MAHHLVLPNRCLSINNEQTRNEFIIQNGKILKNHPMLRHNTAADSELPENLPQELWAAEGVWIRRGGHMPLLSDSPYTVLQCSLRHFRLRMGGKEDNISTSHLKPCTSGSSTLTAAPPWRSRPQLEPPAAAAPPQRVHFTSGS
jgi:hypothetical protein